MQNLIAQDTRRLKIPRPRLKISAEIWNSLVATLRNRGEGCRESAAFLLGHCHSLYRECIDFILLDDLDPRCLRRGAINFDGVHYHELWEICRKRMCDVIADIHTHPHREFISGLDRQNPAIGKRGHVSLIVPFYAMRRTDPRAIGIYQFLGGVDWRTVPPKKRKESLILTEKGEKR